MSPSYENPGFKAAEYVSKPLFRPLGSAPASTSSQYEYAEFSRVLSFFQQDVGFVEGLCQLTLVKGDPRVSCGQVYACVFDETPLVPAPVQLHVKNNIAGLSVS